MPSLRRALAVLAFVFATAAVPASAGPYTDLWWNPNESGWGANVVQADNVVFITFFIYGGDAKPIWYVAPRLEWDGARFTGPLFLTTGSYFAAPWTGAVGQQVGTASFEPSAINNYQATLRYTVAGAGTIVKSIERQTLTTIGLGGQYIGGQTGTYSACFNNTNNGPYATTYNLNVAHASSGQAIFDFAFADGTTCTVSGLLEQHGQLYRIPGASYVCRKNGTTNLNTTANLFDIKATAQGIEGRLAALNAGGNCTENAQFSAVLY